MDQLNMSFMDNDTSVIANRYYNEILSLLDTPIVFFRYV